ncbi:MAG: hypothetical protein IIA90_03945, partial [Chloroflexi bacterium]|nr:hypothetical protein [Chloroflexota bacterium]
HTYGTGKQLRSPFPAVAILLFCSALNNVGDAPNTKLKELIARAEETITEAGLDDDESVKSVIQAAHERASFDRVTKMLRSEFYDGLKSTGHYTEENLNQIVRNIIQVGHAARHEALIDIIEHSTTPVSDFMVINVSTIPEGQPFWDSLLMRRPDGHTFFGAGRLGTLAAQAEKGCAQALLARLQSMKETAS